MDIKRTLTALGLSPREAKIYLSLLSLGKGTAQEIAKKSGEKRVTTYMALKDLAKLGLTRFSKQNKKTLVEAESPENLSLLLHAKANEFRTNELELKKAIPELLNIYSLAKATPTVQFYEGYEGLGALREQFWKVKRKEIVGFVSLDYLFKTFPTHEKEFSPKRAARGIRTRSIYTSSVGPNPKANNPSLLREARFVPPNQFPFESDITIFDDKVALVSLKGELKGVLITSASIANTMRAVFELSWLAAAKFNT